MQSEATTSPPRDSRKLVKIDGHPGFYRRGDRVIAIIYVKGKQTKVYAKTLAEAKRKKAALVTDVDRGEHHGGGRMTFEAYARDWLDRYEGRTQNGIRAHTLADYKTWIERDAIPALGNIRLRDLTLTDLKRYAADLAAGRRKGFSSRKGKDGKPIPLKGKKLSRNSVRLALAPVKAMLSDAHEEGVIRGNPASGLRIIVAKPKAHARTKAALARDEKALSEEPLRALLAATPEQWRLLFETLAHTGLRIGEMVGLKWKNVDLGARRIRVRERFYRGDWNAPKSDFGIRDVPISEGLARSLGDLWRKARPESGEALVFPSGAGTPLDVGNIYKVFKKAAKDAGVPWASFHTLRHTCGTMLRRQGWTAEQVQLFLGHHSSSFTSDVYVHFDEGDVPEPAFFDAITRGAVEASTAGS